MIYDINGTALTESTNTNETALTNRLYDHWLNAPNLNGSKGYLKNYTLDSSGNLKNSNGYAISGFIPLEKNMKIRISDINKINITNSRAYWFKSDRTYYSKKDLSEILNYDGSISGDKYNDMPYMILALSISDCNISVTCEYPKEKNRVDNDWMHSYWTNTEYNKTDYTSTDMTHYGSLIGNSEFFVEKNVRQPKPAYFEIPYLDDFDSYRFEISKYPDMNNASVHVFEVYREYFALPNLEINKTYWVRITGIKDEVERIIAFYSYDTVGLVRQISYVTNMRDIGGHKTEKWGEIRQGRIYRCAKLDGYSESVANGLIELGINCEIDLRLESEIESGYVSPFNDYYNYSIGSFQSVAQNTQSGIENYANIFKYIVSKLKEGKNLLYHCKGGADRTGVMSAILEGVLGASPNTINLDYESTCNNTSLGTIRSDLEDDGHWFSEGMLAIEKREGNTYADKWKGLLIQGGVTEEEIEEFRCIMLSDYKIPTEKGDKGDPGKSAYQIALDNGFEGTEKQWLESLQTSAEEIKAYIDNQIGGTLNDTY